MQYDITWRQISIVLQGKALAQELKSRLVPYHEVYGQHILKNVLQPRKNIGLQAVPVYTVQLELL